MLRARGQRRLPPPRARVRPSRLSAVRVRAPLARALSHFLALSCLFSRVCSIWLYSFFLSAHALFISCSRFLACLFRLLFALQVRGVQRVGVFDGPKDARVPLHPARRNDDARRRRRVGRPPRFFIELCVFLCLTFPSSPAKCAFAFVPSLGKTDPIMPCRASLLIYSTFFPN